MRLPSPQQEVSVVLASHTNGTSYNISSSVPGVSPTGACDAGAGVGVAVSGATCGGFMLTIPPEWQIGNCCVYFPP